MKINLLTYGRLTIIKNAFLKSYVDIYSLIDTAQKDIETVFFIRYMANDYEITFKDISLTELNLIYGKGSSIEFVDTLCPNTKNNLLALSYLSVAEWIWYEANYKKYSVFEFLQMRNKK